MDQSQSPPPQPILTSTIISNTNGPTPVSSSPPPGPPHTPRQRQQSSSPSASSTCSSVGSSSTSTGSSAHTPTTQGSPSKNLGNRNGTLSPSLLFPPSGVLTPPTDTDPEDVHNLHIPKTTSTRSKESKGIPKGRLAFYKEGVLCLELSHYSDDDGDGGHGHGKSITKWSKLDGKVGNRHLIRVTKEVTIPPPPALDTSSRNSSFSHGHPNLESRRTSSSPTTSITRPPFVHVQPNHQRKSSHAQFGSGLGLNHGQTPKKSNASEQYLFYMRPGPCVRASRSKTSQLQHRTYLKKPYYPFLQETLNYSPRCLCTESQKLTKTKISPRIRPTQPKRSLSQLIEQLPLPRFKRSLSCTKSKLQGPITTTTTSRKRASKEHSVTPDPRDHSTTSPTSLSVHHKSKSKKPKSSTKSSPIKKSTILSVPGRRLPSQQEQPTVPSSSIPLQPLPMFYGCDSVQSQADPKESQSAEDSDDSEAEPNLSSTLDTLTPEEQQQFQQEAMSKAISYTINNLLGKGKPIGSARSVPTKTIESGGIGPPKLIHGHGQSQGIPLFSHGIPNPESTPTTLDQTSFLRHLLDTSDPIPITNSPTQNQQSAIPPPPVPAKTKSPKSIPLNNNNSPTIHHPKKSFIKSSGPPVNSLGPRIAHSTSIVISSSPSPSSPFRPIFTSPRNYAPGLKIESVDLDDYEAESQSDQFALDLSSKGSGSGRRLPNYCSKQEPIHQHQLQHHGDDDQDFPLNLCKKARPSI